jgi:hypothetical protein
MCCPSHPLGGVHVASVRYAKRRSIFEVARKIEIIQEYDREQAMAAVFANRLAAIPAVRYLEADNSPRDQFFQA